MRTLSAPDMLDENGQSTGFSDLEVTPTGELAIAGGEEALRQRVLQRLRFWRGEWFLDGEDGVPYLTEIFDRPLQPGLMSVLLIEQVRRVDIVDRVEDVSYTFDAENRVLYWNAVVIGSDDLAALVRFFVGV